MTVKEKIRTGFIALLLAVALYAGVAANIYYGDKINECEAKGMIPVRDVRPFSFQIQCAKELP